MHACENFHRFHETSGSKSSQWSRMPSLVTTRVMRAPMGTSIPLHSSARVRATVAYSQYQSSYSRGEHSYSRPASLQESRSAWSDAVTLLRFTGELVWFGISGPFEYFEGNSKSRRASGCSSRITWVRVGDGGG